MAPAPRCADAAVRVFGDQSVTRTVRTTGCSAPTWLRTKAVKSAGVPGDVVTPS